ncbi:MAG: hypothetical protein SF339_25515 [Blastocatellia bacterium]|nr:hypothetical protein [Blastocatellia bacterium]
MKPLLKNLFGDLVAAIFIFCPRSRRFRFALRLSHRLHPLVRLAERLGVPRMTFSGPRERMMMFLVHRMLEWDLDFEPELEVRPAELLAEREGALLLSCHMWMNVIWLRWLRRRERRVCLLTVMPSLDRQLGRNLGLERIPPDAHAFLQIRRRVREGALIHLALDILSPREGLREVEIGDRRYYFSDHTFHFAHRSGLPVLFVFPHLNEQGRVIVRLERPIASRPEEMFEEYCRFMRDGAARLRA